MSKTLANIPCPYVTTKLDATSSSVSITFNNGADRTVEGVGGMVSPTVFTGNYYAFINFFNKIDRASPL